MSARELALAAAAKMQTQLSPSAPVVVEPAPEAPAAPAAPEAPVAEEPEVDEVEEALDLKDPKAKPAKEKKGSEEDGPEPKAWRKWRNERKQVNESVNKVVEELAPVKQGFEHAKAGKWEDFLGALAAQGVDTHALIEGLTGYAMAAPPPKAEPKQDPRVERMLAKVEEEEVQAKRQEVREVLGQRLKGHKAIQAEGGMEELIKRLEASVDPKTGKTKSPKAVADEMVEEARKRAKAFGFLPDEDQDETPEPEYNAPSAPTGGRNPTKVPVAQRTAEDWHQIALNRALRSKARK